ncbi:MAG: sigma-70 family RNA polymerase sigma factor [Wenzhouxiangellaceae bacterium]
MAGDRGIEHQQQLTRVLQQFNQDGGKIAAEAMPLIYEELRRLAQGIMRTERPGHTLQATAIVNEVYIRLVEDSGVEFQNRAHFIGRVAHMMRRFLVDYARERNAQKRGGGLHQVTLGAAEGISGGETDLVDLDDALLSLSKKDPDMVRLVELRYFGGLSLEQTAEVLGISRASVVLAWRRTKVWLQRELSQE